VRLEGKTKEPAQLLQETKGHEIAMLALQKRFLLRYAELGRTVEACRRAQVASSVHYQWLQEDPTYRSRFRAVRSKAAHRLDREAVRRERHRVPKLVIYNGEPVLIEGKPLFAREYSDRLLVKLLEAKETDRFNWERLPDSYDELTREHLKVFMASLKKFAPPNSFDATHEEKVALLAYLKKMIRMVEVLRPYRLEPVQKSSTGRQAAVPMEQGMTGEKEHSTNG
jgi:hypothetical protein